MSRLNPISGQRGFTLTELVVGMALGMIILLAAFTVIDRSFLGNKAIADREDALQRGRNALELITRQLRSQVCVQQSPALMPITNGADTTMTFFTYLGDPTAATSAQRDPTTNQPFPEQHKITYASNKITESDAKVTSISPLVVASPYKTTTLATNVILPNGKLFQYYAAGTGSSSVSSTPLTTTLSAADEANVVEMAVAFKVLPTGIAVTDTGNKQATTFQDYVFWRAIDPEDPTGQPCDSG
jgi:prepilin-type N-terminal cleavage/methylation domain-containing protein